MKDAPKEWDGWYFYEDYLCSPVGNRYTPLKIEACFFLSQMESVRELLRPQQVEQGPIAGDREVTGSIYTDFSHSTMN